MTRQPRVVMHTDVVVRLRLATNNPPTQASRRSLSSGQLPERFKHRLDLADVQAMT
jgi:hypothetical protein